MSNTVRAYSTLILEQLPNGVGRLTLNRPDALNALGAELKAELAQAVAEIRLDPEIRVLILTGAGRGFCAGGDTKAMGNRTALNSYDNLNNSASNYLIPLAEMEKPVIAAVNGFAVGAGFNLALAADFIIAAEEAKFSQIFTQVGLIPDTGGHWFLPRWVGMARAKELVLTGRMIDAREAERLGIAFKVVQADQLQAEAIALAEQLAAGPMRALGMAKKLLNKSYELTLKEMLELEATHQAIISQTDDHKEGVRARAERRKPQFRGE